MARVNGWSEEELERRASALAVLLQTVWAKVAQIVAALVGKQPVVTAAHADHIPLVWNAELEDGILGYIRDTYLDAAGNVIEAVDDPEAGVLLIGDEPVEQYLKAARNRLRGIADDVWEAIREQIIEGNRLGESVKEIAARIKNTANISDGRALTIARTEIHAAQEAGSYAQAVAIDPDGKKTWLATDDDRTRPSHRHADNQTVKINEPFIVGGVPLRFPGDPLGPPHETINCRCSVAYDLVSLGETVDAILSLTASPYDDNHDLENLDKINDMDDDDPLVAAMKKKWDPHKHPRGADGRFIPKGSLLFDLLTEDNPSTSKVVKGLDTMKKSEWDNLKPEQKQKLYDLAQKAKDAKEPGSFVVFNQLHKWKSQDEAAESAEKTISDIDKALEKAQKAIPATIYKKHEDGTVVAIHKEGHTRMVWNAKTKKYELQSKNSQGDWYTTSSMTKTKAYESLKKAPYWVTPPKSEQKTTPKVKTSEVPSVKETSKVDTPSTDADAVFKKSFASGKDFSSFKQVGGQAGSNVGGLFEAPNGDRYYIKKAKSEKHAANEQLAAALYNLAGIDTPYIIKGKGAPNIGEGLQTATRIVPGAKSDLKAKLKDKDYIGQIRNGFAIDAWLANWDVAGLVYDNVVTDKDGKPWRIDVGGALLFRAQGAPKGALFGDEVKELDTLRDPKMNPQSARIFGDMTEDEIRASVARLEKITPEQIDEAVKKAGFDESVAKTLKNRRQYILDKYPPLKKDVAPEPLAPSEVDTKPTNAKEPPDFDFDFDMLNYKSEQGTLIPYAPIVSTVGNGKNDKPLHVKWDGESMVPTFDVWDDEGNFYGSTDVITPEFLKQFGDKWTLEISPDDEDDSSEWQHAAAEIAKILDFDMLNKQSKEGNITPGTILEGMLGDGETPIAIQWFTGPDGAGEFHIIDTKNHDTLTTVKELTPDYLVKLGYGWTKAKRPPQVMSTPDIDTPSLLLNVKDPDPLEETSWKPVSATQWANINAKTGDLKSGAIVAKGTNQKGEVRVFWNGYAFVAEEKPVGSENWSFIGVFDELSAQEMEGIGYHWTSPFALADDIDTSNWKGLSDKDVLDINDAAWNGDIPYNTVVAVGKDKDLSGNDIRVVWDGHGFLIESSPTGQNSWSFVGHEEELTPDVLSENGYNWVSPHGSEPTSPPPPSVSTPPEPKGAKILPVPVDWDAITQDYVDGAYAGDNDMIMFSPSTNLGVFANNAPNYQLDEVLIVKKWEDGEWKPVAYAPFDKTEINQHATDWVQTNGFGSKDPAPEVIGQTANPPSAEQIIPEAPVFVKYPKANDPDPDIDAFLANKLPTDTTTNIGHTVYQKILDSNVPSGSVLAYGKDSAGTKHRIVKKFGTAHVEHKTTSGWHTDAVLFDEEALWDWININTDPNSWGEIHLASNASDVTLSAPSTLPAGKWLLDTDVNPDVTALLNNTPAIMPDKKPGKVFFDKVNDPSVPEGAVLGYGVHTDGTYMRVIKFKEGIRFERQKADGTWSTWAYTHSQTSATSFINSYTEPDTWIELNPGEVEVPTNAPSSNVPILTTYPLDFDVVDPDIPAILTNYPTIVSQGKDPATVLFQKALDPNIFEGAVIGYGRISHGNFIRAVKVGDGHIRFDRKKPWGWEDSGDYNFKEPISDFINSFTNPNSWVEITPGVGPTGKTDTPDTSLAPEFGEFLMDTSPDLDFKAMFANNPQGNITGTALFQKTQDPSIPDGAVIAYGYYKPLDAYMRVVKKGSSAEVQKFASDSIVPNDWIAIDHVLDEQSITGYSAKWIDVTPPSTLTTPSNTGISGGNGKPLTGWKKSDLIVNKKWNELAYANWNSGDVVALSTDGKHQIIAEYNPGVGGIIFEITEWDPKTNSWAKMNLLGTKGLMATKYYPPSNIAESWIPANLVDAPTPIPPAPGNNAPKLPGGVPLTGWTEDDLLKDDKWVDLANKSWEFGDVLALSTDGNYRIVKGYSETFGKNLLVIEEWDSSSNSWKKTDYTGVAGSMKSGTFPHKYVTTAWVPADFKPTAGSAGATILSQFDKKKIKKTLSTANVGYWSKPEKIWDQIVAIQKDYAGQDKYVTPMQILQALDEQTNIKKSKTPYTDKISKWISTYNGSVYAKNSGVNGLTWLPGGKTATPTITPTTPFKKSGPTDLGKGDIIGISDLTKQQVYQGFKQKPESYLSSPPSSTYNNAKAVAQAHGLSILQVLKIVDELSAKKADKPNASLFEKKIVDWLKTPQGYAFVTTGEIPMPPTPEFYSPKIGNKLSHIPTFTQSSKYTYTTISVAEAYKFWDEVAAKWGPLTPEQKSAVNSYSFTYTPLNEYLRGVQPNISPTHMKAIKNLQKAMRPSTRPLLLHRGTSLNGLANATSYDDLKSKIGQTWKAGNFFSTSVGGKAAFGGRPLIIEIEAPPGTPMVWTRPHSGFPNENEMTLAAGLHYRILDVWKTAGQIYARVRVVPEGDV